MNKEKTMLLLEALQRDSSQSAAVLAEQLHLKEAEVAAEIKALQEEGILLGSEAVIDWDKVSDEKVNALIEVRVSPQNGLGFDKIAKEIAKFKEVSAVYLMSGGYDFAVMLERKSMKEISRFVYEKLAPLPSISSTATHFIMRKYKDKGVSMYVEPEDKRIERIL